MAHTFEELRAKNVGELREIAESMHDDAVQGYTQMNKDHLLEALCKALNIDMYVHHEVVGIDKTAIKNKIKELKAQRDEALGAKDSARLKLMRRKIHHLKRRLHKATV